MPKKLVRVRRISVTTKDFYVVTELATTVTSAAHDRVGRAKAGSHDSVASCCVAIKEAKVRDRSGQVRTTGEFCLDRLGQ